MSKKGKTRNMIRIQRVTLLLSLVAVGASVNIVCFDLDVGGDSVAFQNADTTIHFLLGNTGGRNWDSAEGRHYVYS